jgi:hypothetical protein
MLLFSGVWNQLSLVDNSRKLKSFLPVVTIGAAYQGETRGWRSVGARDVPIIGVRCIDRYAEQ